MGLEACTCVHLVDPQGCASDTLNSFCSSVRRSHPASRSFVLASLRALHLDPGHSSARGRKQEVQGKPCLKRLGYAERKALTNPLLSGMTALAPQGSDRDHQRFAKP
jgi:hypothetical protein